MTSTSGSAGTGAEPDEKASGSDSAAAPDDAASGDAATFGGDSAQDEAAAGQDDGAAGGDSASGSTSAKGSSAGGSTSGATASGSSSRETNASAPREYARRALGEQMDSSVNLSKLAAGKIRRFTVEGGGQSGSRYSASIRASFTDGTSAPGDLALSRFQNTWYFSSMQGRRTTEGGEAGSVSKTGGISSKTGVPSSLVSVMISQTNKNQAVFRSMVGGDIKSVSIDSVDRGVGTATLAATISLANGSTRSARIGMLRSNGYWFLVRFSYT